MGNNIVKFVKVWVAIVVIVVGGFVVKIKLIIVKIIIKILFIKVCFVRVVWGWI